MEDNTNQTPGTEDNKLGISDKNLINEHEAKGIAAAELFIFRMDSDSIISAQLILEIHRIAFSELYEWAGKWRTKPVTVGQLIPPEPSQVVNLVYQFTDNLNFKISSSKTAREHLNCLLYSHYEFIRVHPFVNGNGRTGRILMNIVALKLGYRPLELYHREGDSRKIYIDAMRAADRGDMEPLSVLIGKELRTF